VTQLRVVGTSRVYKSALLLVEEGIAFNLGVSSLLLSPWRRVHSRSLCFSASLTSPLESLSTSSLSLCLSLLSLIAPRLSSLAFKFSFGQDIQSLASCLVTCEHVSAGAPMAVRAWLVRGSEGLDLILSVQKTVVCKLPPFKLCNY
jgi:hypothetical protein